MSKTAKYGAGLLACLIVAVILIIGRKDPAQPDTPQKNKQEQVAENIKPTEISAPIDKPNSYGTEQVQNEESPFASFNEWANNRAVRAEAGKNDPVSQEELDMAIARREALLKLIKNDPESALKQTIPLSVRRWLPEEIQKELEQHISGIGDYTVIAIDYPPGVKEENLIDRWVRIDGKRFRAYVYGRREKHITKQNIPLHGIAIGNEMALHERSIHWQEDKKNPDEI